uniref:PIPK domain-containing protein n=1 Tax=Noctiluca scintillans TaxID=2966 RepID=A0A7S1A134_NOCSC|mmetsp:Transcript_27444/g.72231  ORF Transcript_27444/g.72231 Transcript_27444/m.72231 type:complete len:474 (+) Transcript_27444:75-1496(+)
MCVQKPYMGVSDMDDFNGGQQPADPNVTTNTQQEDPGDGDDGGGLLRAKPRSRSQLRECFRRGVHQAMALNSGIKKVPIGNKIGLAPEGELGIVALALQRGIHHEHEHPKWTMPETSAFDFPQPSCEFELVHPELFSRVRKTCGIHPVRYVAALEVLEKSHKKPTVSVINSSDAAGKSASFFFLSPDQQFLAKSFEEADTAALRSILPEYVQHLDNEPSSLLPRYLGLYRLVMKVKDGKGGEKPDTIWIGVMPNLFAGIHVISLRYDLKGSTAGRTASEKERIKKRPVYKDNDWIRSGQRISLPSNAHRDEFLRLVRTDAKLLASHRLMDYSLLIGVHSKDEETSYHCAEANNVITVETEEHIFYVGIVDILTKYGSAKRAETLLSGTLRCRNVSCQPPNKYAQRFVHFITDSVDIHEGSKAFGMWDMKTGYRMGHNNAVQDAPQAGQGQGQGQGQTQSRPAAFDPPDDVISV